MQTLYNYCAGLDIHKKTVSVCIIVPDAQGDPVKTKRTFSTMTTDLLRMADWLREQCITHVVLESTGVYWKPVYNLLENEFTLTLANAREVKNLPGRKTDLSDAEWLAELHRHGLIRGSFVPPPPVRALRDLTRYRTSLIQERVREVNRLQKFLEDANLKLSSVVTDLTGVSARLMLEQLLAGDTDPVALADLARGRLRTKQDLLIEALQGQLKPHHHLLLTTILHHLDVLEESIHQISALIEEELRPFEELVERLDRITGLNRRAIEGILAEIGLDLATFPTHEHLSSWAGVCPGNRQSGGKRGSGKITPGSPWLRSLLIQAAMAAGRSKDTYLGSLYHRMAARKGKKKAAVAVAHTILVIVFHMIKDGTEYQELGAEYVDQINRESTARRLKKRLESLGFAVNLVDQRLHGEEVA